MEWYFLRQCPGDECFTLGPCSFVGGSLEYNPYAARCTQLQQQIAALEAAHSRRVAAITWYDRLDIDELSTRFHATGRDCAGLERQCKQLANELASVRVAVKRLEGLTAFSFDPRKLFSDERKENKRQLGIQRDKGMQLQKRLDAVESQLGSAQ